jgi:hypothetical protein
VGPRRLDDMERREILAPLSNLGFVKLQDEFFNVTNGKHVLRVSKRKKLMRIFCLSEYK